MNFRDYLEIRDIYESGIKIGKDKESFKVLHHNDADGVGAAKAIRDQIIEQISKRWRVENKKIGGKQAREMKDTELKNLIDKRISFNKVTDGMKEPEVLPLIKAAGPKQMLIVVDFDRFSQFGKNVMRAIRERGGFDYHSDHHETDEKMQSKSGKTGATSFKSDTEHVGSSVNLKFNPKLAAQFSKWDSATFDENIKKELGIEPGDPKYKPVRELGTILTTISRTNYDKDYIDYFIKNSKDSLVSMLSTARKIMKAHNKIVKASHSLERASFFGGKKGREYKEIADKLKQELLDDGLKEFANKIDKNFKGKEIETDFSGKNKMEYEKATVPREEKEKIAKEREASGKKGTSNFDFKPLNKYVVFSDLSAGHQPGRYLFSAIPNELDPELKGYMSGIRYWEGFGFMQASISPDAPKEVKEKVDLSKITKKVLEDTEKKFGNRFNGWAFEIIKKEAGGHKGITNVGSFGLLGLMPKGLRNELKELQPLVNRLKKINRISGRGKESEENKEAFLERAPGIKEKLKRFQELNDIKKTWAKNKKEVMRYVKDRYAHYIGEEVGKALNTSANESIINSKINKLFLEVKRK
jgi:hypothetical protein